MGHVGLHALGHLGHEHVLEGALGGLGALGGELLLDVGLQLLQGVELGHVLGELIVQGGDFLDLDLVDLDVEHHGLAGQLGGVVLGEGDVDVLLLAGLHADELLLEAGDEAAGADLQIEVLALAAIEGHAVVKALEIDVGGVALLDGALHGHETAVAVGHFLQAGVDIGGHDLDLGLGRFQTLILAQLHLGVHGHGTLEHHAVLGAGLQLHLGIAHHVQLLLLHSGLVGIGQDNIDSFLVEHLRAVHLLDDLAGGFAHTEAGYVDLTAHLQIRLVDGGLELLGARLDGQSDAALFQFLAAFHSHFLFPPFRMGVVYMPMSIHLSMITEKNGNFHCFFSYSQIFLGTKSSQSPATR